METELARNPFACAVIDKIGGTAATARLCEVKLPSVSEWRRTGIPRARLQFLRLACPSVFREINESELSQASDD